LDVLDVVALAPWYLLSSCFLLLRVIPLHVSYKAMIGNLSLYSAFSLAWPAAMEQKKIGTLQQKKIFEWPPFYCFGTPISRTDVMQKRFIGWRIWGCRCHGETGSVMRRIALWDCCKRRFFPSFLPIANNRRDYYSKTFME